VGGAVQGVLADLIGPRPLIVPGGILAALAWTINSKADSLLWIYVGNSTRTAPASYGVSIGAPWWFLTGGLAAGLTASAARRHRADHLADGLRSRGVSECLSVFGLGQEWRLLTALIPADRTTACPCILDTAAVHPQQHPTQMLASPMFC
jgi:hypothetical protein